MKQIGTTNAVRHRTHKRAQRNRINMKIVHDAHIHAEHTMLTLAQLTSSYAMILYAQKHTKATIK